MSAIQPSEAHYQPTEHHHQAPQLTLEETAVEACSRKRHAVERGYFEDPYLRHFTRDATYLNSPLMNRGYWLRVRAVESAINRFVEALPEGAPFQVLSLGGGFDTLFFRWAGLATNADPEPAAHATHATDKDACEHEARQFALGRHSAAGVALCQGRLRRFVEVDQRDVVTGKRRVIQHNADVAALAGMKSGQPIAAPLEAAAEPHQADVYRLVAADLRKVDELCVALTATPATDAAAAVASAASEVSVFGSAPRTPLLDPEVPTIVIAECVLVYMKAAESQALLQGLTTLFAGAPAMAVLSYDAIRPTTPFGKQMVSSLAARGLELRGIHDLPNPAAHLKRYASSPAEGGLGFPAAAVWTMKDLFAQVPAAVAKRLSHLEMIDDYDEWCLVQEHYCMSWAVRVGATTGAAADTDDAPKNASAPPRLFF